MKKIWKFVCNFFGKFSGDGSRNIVYSRDLKTELKGKYRYAYVLGEVYYNSIRFTERYGFLHIVGECSFLKYDNLISNSDKKLVDSNYQGTMVFDRDKFIAYPGYGFELEFNIFSNIEGFGVSTDINADYLRTYYLPNVKWENFPVIVCDSKYLHEDEY